MRVAGIAPQLTATNGFSLRGERLWIARATISLPVPALAGDDDARVRGRDLLHELEDPVHRGPGADHVGAGREGGEAPPQQLHLAHRLLLLERALEHEPAAAGTSSGFSMKS